MVKVNTSGFWDQRKAIYSSLIDRLPGRLPRGGGTQTAHRTGAFSSISHFMAEHSMRNEVIHRSCQIRSFMLHVYWVLCKDCCFDVVWKVGSSPWELGERMEEQQKNWVPGLGNRQMGDWSRLVLGGTLTTASPAGGRVSAGAGAMAVAVCRTLQETAAGRIMCFSFFFKREILPIFSLLFYSHTVHPNFSSLHSSKSLS